MSKVYAGGHPDQAYPRMSWTHNKPLAHSAIRQTSANSAPNLAWLQSQTHGIQSGLKIEFINQGQFLVAFERSQSLVPGSLKSALESTGMSFPRNSGGGMRETVGFVLERAANPSNRLKFVVTSGGMFAVNGDIVKPTYWQVVFAALVGKHGRWHD